MNDHEAIIALNMIPGLGSVRLKKLFDACGSPQAVMKLSHQALCAIDDIGPVCARAITRGVDPAVIDRELRAVKDQGVEIITWGDAHYPALLRHIYDPPMVLYSKGSLPQIPMIAIVGTRQATNYGRTTAAKFARACVTYDCAVVSGLARGIDASAHAACCQAQGQTVAVLGCGLGWMHPIKEKTLAGHILEQGCLLSEFAMFVPPDKGNFPRRNRLISGLAQGVLVVEAAQRSGALITAHAALEQGREVFAVPGDIRNPVSAGCHKLIQEGATLVTSMDDIAQELGGIRPARGGCCDQEKSRVPITDDERELLKQFDFTPQYIDTLCDRCERSPGELSALLFSLEMKGYLQQLPGRMYALK